MDYDFGVMRAPGRIIFGKGQVAVLGKVARELGARALVCTDERVASIPLIDKVRADLEASGLEVRVFSGTQPELPVDGVEDCVRRFEDYAPDVIIGLGGGSCLDLAKLVSLWLAHGAPLSAYYGELKVSGPVVPVIAVPTTAGTGSEVTPVAVLGDNTRELKVGISSPHLIPAVAICDPELTLSCPARLTAISGADALTHAIEAVSATKRSADEEIAVRQVFVGRNVLSDIYGMTAIRLIFAHIERAVSQPDDIDARSAMMLGSAMAGLAFGSAGTSAAHAIQYPIGALSKSAHGLGVAVLLPHAMRFNMGYSRAVYARIGREIGVIAEDEASTAENTVSAVAGLFARIGIPADLGALGVDPSQAAWIAERSMLSARLVENNPRPLDQQGVLEILAGAFAHKTQSAEPLS